YFMVLVCALVTEIGHARSSWAVPPRWPQSRGHRMSAVRYESVPLARIMPHHSNAPGKAGMTDSTVSLKELTLRGTILGALITLVFTASNVYLGLKVGLTFASSIPAAVISMAVLRAFQGSNILENNIVQTQASAAGTLSAIIFMLPALLMMGYWSGFPLLQTALICACGGILGVICTVALRRALIVNSDLPYPEGVAAAEILGGGDEEAGPGRQSGEGLREIMLGGAMAGTFSLMAGGF